MNKFRKWMCMLLLSGALVMGASDEASAETDTSEEKKDVTGEQDTDQLNQKKEVLSEGDSDGQNASGGDASGGKATDANAAGGNAADTSAVDGNVTDANAAGGNAADANAAGGNAADTDAAGENAADMDDAGGDDADTSAVDGNVIDANSADGNAADMNAIEGNTYGAAAAGEKDAAGDSALLRTESVNVLGNSLEENPEENPENDPENDPEEGTPDAQSAIVDTGIICHPAQSVFEGGNRVWFYNVAGGVANGDLIIVESEGHWGLIDAGPRYTEDPVTDAAGNSYPSPWLYEDGSLAAFSVQAEGRNGRDAAIYMIETLGIRHLDFIISSHAHSDHSGGIPEIVGLTLEDETGTWRLVDEDTVYLKKEYHHISPVQDDLGEELQEDGWHTQAYDYQAIRAVEEAGGKVVDISNGIRITEEKQTEADFSEVLDAIASQSFIQDVTYTQGETEDYYDDHIDFLFGQFRIGLYNLFSRVDNTLDDNANAIATVISDGENQVFTAGDLNVMYETQQQVARAVQADYGEIELMKACDHGANLAFAREMMDLFRPTWIVTPNKREVPTNMDTTGAYFAALYYSRENFGTTAYEVGASDRGIVVEFGQDDLQIYQLQGEKESAEFASADPCINPVLKKSEGWVTWKQTVWEHGYTADFYYFRDGAPLTGWQDLGENRFYFGEDGFMCRGWLEENGEKYYLKKDGAMRTGWMAQDGLYYYFDPESGASSLGWITDEKATYYLLPSQQVLTGFHRIGDDGYYFRPDGSMKTGWLQTDEGWRYFDEEGRLCSGFTEIEGRVYNLENGFMARGWVELDGARIYFGSDGSMQTGWTEIGKGTYFFREDGHLATGWFRVDGQWYHSADSGMLDSGWYKEKNIQYYLDGPNGMATGWLFLNGKMYYFSKAGAMVTGWKCLDGAWYLFSDQGVAATGWVQQDDGWYYFDAKGAMSTGWKQIGSRWYYFRKNGTMRSGWVRSAGKWYYLDEQKGMVTGWLSLDGKWYYLDGQTGLVTGWQSLHGKWYYFNGDGVMLTGRQTIGRRTYTFGENGVWIQG